MNYIEKIKKEIKEIKKKFNYSSDEDAFTHWALKLVSKASDTECSDAFTGGKDDLGIDAILCIEDMPNNKIYILQTKFIKENNRIERKEIREFWKSAVQILKDESFARKGNERIIRQSRIARDLIKKTNTKITFVFITSGRFTPSSKEEIERIKKEEIDNVLEGEYEILFFDYDRNGIVDIYRRSLDIFEPAELNPTLSIVRKEYFERLHEVNINKSKLRLRSLIFTAKASEIAKLRNEKGLSLLSLNVRYSFSSEINKKILETAENSSKNDKFWYFNNGIYAICEDFKIDKKGGRIKIKRLQIVNGCQTSTAFAEAITSGANLDNVEVLFRLVAIPKGYKEFLDDISIFTNTQNPVKQRDLRSRDTI